MAQEIYVVIEFDRETHGFSEIEAICKSKEEAENLVKDYNARYLRYSYEWFEETYDADEADAVLAEKDKEIEELKAKLENINELIKSANKFVDDLKNTDCSKKDDEIKRLKKSVQFFSDLHHNECESAKECFRRLMDLGLIDGWGLTKKFFVMPKYTKERLAQFEKQDAEIRRLKRKRCLAMAKWCEAILNQYPSFGEISAEERRLDKWCKRWLELAEKFKEAK